MTIHILPNIFQSEANQTTKLGQLKEHNKRNIFLKNHARNEAGRLVSDLFSLFKKALNEGKASSLQLSFNIFR